MSHDPTTLSRKELLTASLVSLALAAVPSVAQAQNEAAPEITLDDLRAMEKIAGFELTDEERKAALAEVRRARAGYTKVRELPIEARTAAPVPFRPFGASDQTRSRVRVRTSLGRARLPMRSQDIAFLSIAELGHLLRTRQTTSVELTKLYLDRLKRYGDRLLCVVTLTEELALRQAARADQELRAGKDRGPLHGIPYGIKDLFATKGIPTTWGAEPYKDQVFDYDAAVVERLEAAGAVLVAKLSLGALAMGDVWFRGTTKNPWNEKQGSGGSSAGSAAAAAAGLVAFTIGTETLGSIISPSLRCHVTGFRPTFGRVSRYGAMELSATMDKVGPICRSVEDCALVFAALCGRDARDPATVERPFDYPRRVDLRRLRVGYLGTADALAKDPAAVRLRELGATVEPVTFTPVPNGVTRLLEVEAASAFDAFTRGDAIDKLQNSAWPGIFRAARFVPAVEYIQSQRARAIVMERFEREFGDRDILLGTGVSAVLVHTNLTGHPQIHLPFGDDGKGNRLGRSLIGRLYRDDELLTVARRLQDAFAFHRLRPEPYG